MVTNSSTNFIYEDYEQSTRYNIQDIIDVLGRYLGKDEPIIEGLKEIEIKNIKDLKRVLLRNKREIIENIIDTNPNLVFNIELDSGLGQIKDMYRSTTNPTQIIRLRNEMPTWLSNDDFLKLCFSVYEIAKGKDNKKEAIIEDYQNKTSNQIARILPKLQKKKLSKDIQRRYNSKEVLGAFRFIDSLLPEENRGNTGDISTLGDFIGENNEILVERLKDINLSLENIYKVRQLLIFLKREFPETAKDIYITDKTISNINNYIGFDKIIENYKESIIKDLIDKGYKKEEIDDNFIKLYFSKRIGKKLQDLEKEPKNELSKLNEFVKDGKMSLDFYKKTLDLINTSHLKLDIDKFINIFFFIGEDKLNLFINRINNKDKIIKLINNDIQILFDKLNIFNIEDGTDKFFSVLKSSHLERFLKVFNTIKEDKAELNRFSILLLELPINKILNLIEKIKIDVLLNVFKSREILDNFIIFYKNLQKDISSISIDWELFFTYKGDSQSIIYRNMAFIINQVVNNNNFAIKTLQLNNTYGVYALFDLVEALDYKEIISYINGEKRGFLKGELSLSDLYKKKIGKPEIWVDS